MKNLIILLMLTLCMVSCESGSSSSAQETYEVAIEEPEFIEQEVTYTCTTCGGSGQVYGYYGPQNCPGCTAYGRSPQYTTTQTVRNPSFKGSSGKKCTYTVGCDCSGFQKSSGDIHEEEYCKNCHHHRQFHHSY